MNEPKLLCVNAAAEAFWRLPEGFVAALGRRLPGWTVAVAETASELVPLLRRCHAVVGWPFPPALCRSAKHLEWVHFFTAGVPESWGAAAAREGGPRVTATEGSNADAVAEHGLLLTLLAVRGVTKETLATPHGEPLVPRAASRLGALVVGAGAVGGRLARLLAPLFLEVRLTARHAPSDVPAGVTFLNVTAWDELVPWADAIVLALPSTAASRALFGAPFFARLKDDALLVNVARGELLEDDALLAFLARSSRSRYVTDVTAPEPYPADGPLAGHPRVIVTPHVAARRDDAWEAILERTLAILPPTEAS